MNFTRNHLTWLLCCVVAGLVLVIYVSASRAAGRGEILLPLDDVYIHFQYARQLANGQPYVYNPGQPPTSGATSFLYPYVLAIGYTLGFQGLNLGLWAMLIGALALLGSVWLVYWLAREFNGPDWLAVLVSLIFGLTGAVQWHFMSGMETGLMMLFTLATLYAVVTDRLRLFVVAASLLALTRPEGGVLAVIAVAVAYIHRTRCTVSLQKRQPIWLLLPILMLGVQPLVNLLVTGSVVASGNSAKSLLGMVPFYWDVVLGRIWDNFSRMWGEFVTGVSPREGLYIPFLIGPLALVALVISLLRRDRWHVSLLVLLWLLAGTAAIATLDTAFWHFKRYQMPLMALFFPLAAWALTQIFQRKDAAPTGGFAQAQSGNWARHAVPLRYMMIGLVGAALIIVLPTSTAFLHHFALNVNYVYLQPFQMARWLEANTPEDALIAVHDVGMMRYMGGRNTLDMVGLTTPGAAAYWRNGPGSIAEFLIKNRPDYIASYGKGHGLGLGMIAETSIYGESLAEFPVEWDDHYNVALAADFQGIYQPDWSFVSSDFAETSPNSNILNVANLESEADFEYQWENHERLPGFPTDLIEFRVPERDRNLPANVVPGRRLNGSEIFTIPIDPDGEGLLIVSLFHAAHRGTLNVFFNNQLIDRNWIPEMPGQIIWAGTYIPSELLDSDDVTIRIEPDTPGGYYMPLVHITGQTELHVIERDDEPLVAVYQNGAIELPEYITSFDSRGLVLQLFWNNNGESTGDYRFFAHLYDDINQPPVAQVDTYPGQGTLPPGNWLPGPNWNFVVVDLSDVAPGTYQLAIGFYDPYTGERLMPESDLYDVSPDGRLFLGEVDVPAAAE